MNCGIGLCGFAALFILIGVGFPIAAFPLTVQEKLFSQDLEAHYDACEKVAKLDKKALENLSQDISRRLSDPEDSTREMAILSTECLPEVKKDIITSLIRIIDNPEETRQNTEVAIRALGEIGGPYAADVIPVLIKNLYDDQFRSASFSALAAIGQPATEPIKAQSKLSQSAKDDLLANIYLRHSTMTFIPVYIFNDIVFAPQNIPNYQRVSVGSKWHLVGTQGSVNVQINSEKNISGISCDLESIAEPVYPFKVLASEIGIPLIAYGPLVSDSSYHTNVEPEKKPTQHEISTIVSALSKTLQTELESISPPEISIHLTARPNAEYKVQFDSSFQIMHIANFKEGTIIEYLGRTPKASPAESECELCKTENTEPEACLRFISSDLKVGPCTEVTLDLSAFPGERIYSSFKNPATGETLFAVHTIDEPWKRDKGTWWGPERSIYRLEKDLKLSPLMSNQLDPRCREAI